MKRSPIPVAIFRLGMFLASGVISLLYVVMIFITVGTVDAEKLSGSLVPNLP